MTKTGTNFGQRTAQLLIDRYRYPEEIAHFTASGTPSSESGYFKFGPDVICYGQCASGKPAKKVTESLHDSSAYVDISGSSVDLSFDPAQIINNLHYERYAANWSGAARTVNGDGIFRDTYYLMRPLIPGAIRKYIQRLSFRGWDKVQYPVWPVDRTVEGIVEQLLVLSMKARNLSRIPFVWFWPDGAQSCTIMTHDVETFAGVEFCSRLMDLDDEFSIKSSFQIVPENRYPVAASFLEGIRKRGFEVNVHDLNHDGLLFSHREQFLRRAERINVYAREYQAQGFRAGVMYRNADWFDALNFSYDMSIPNVAHLDPQRGGCCTVLPFFIGKIVELPVTTTQDYTLFEIFNDYTIDLWKRQISLIRQKHGLISFIVHPDYLIRDRARQVYVELLRYLYQLRSEGATWIASPHEVADWWRLRDRLTIVREGDSWHIDGDGSQRARIAYASLDGGQLSYEVAAGG